MYFYQAFSHLGIPTFCSPRAGRTDDSFFLTRRGTRERLATDGLAIYVPQPSIARSVGVAFKRLFSLRVGLISTDTPTKVTILVELFWYSRLFW